MRSGRRPRLGHGCANPARPPAGLPGPPRVRARPPRVRARPPCV